MNQIQETGNHSACVGEVFNQRKKEKNPLSSIGICNSVLCKKCKFGTQIKIKLLVDSFRI